MFTYFRQANAIFPPRILTTWEEFFRDSLYMIPERHLPHLLSPSLPKWRAGLLRLIGCNYINRLDIAQTRKRMGDSARRRWMIVTAGYYLPLSCSQLARPLAAISVRASPNLLSGFVCLPRRGSPMGTEMRDSRNLGPAL